MEKVINIYATNLTSNNPSRATLLDWVNSSLKAKFTKIEELCTGAAYCQFMYMLFPNCINLHRVRFTTNQECEFIENFKILQGAFQKMNVTRKVPMEQLVKGRITDNMEFLQWFKRFFDANFRDEFNDYDALAVRKGVPMGYGPGGARRAPQAGRKSVAPEAKKITRANSTIQEGKTYRSNPTVLIRSNTEILEDRTKSATPTIPVIPMVLIRSKKEILEDRVPCVETEQEPAIVVVKPQVDEKKSATPDEQQPVVPEEHLPTVEHLPGERPAAEREESKEQKDKPEIEETGSLPPEMRDFAKTFHDKTKEELLLDLHAAISETHYYYEKCLKIEQLVYDREVTTENKDVLDILYDADSSSLG